MPPPQRPERRPLTRAELPSTFTPDTIRQLDMATIRRLSHRNNGVLSADEQRDFDRAVREVTRPTTDWLDQSLRRFGRDRAAGFDPELRQSYLRTRDRLEAQAQRARTSFPHAGGLEDDATPAPLPTVTTDQPGNDGDDVSLGSFETEIEQTSEMLVLLERIASIEQQQLEHHRSQVLRDVRGLFFAAVVSVAVIVAGVAPLVEAALHHRTLIILWTLAVCAAAGLAYAAVRLTQSSRKPPASP